MCRGSNVGSLAPTSSPTSPRSSSSLTTTPYRFAPTSASSRWVQVLQPGPALNRSFRQQVRVNLMFVSLCTLIDVEFSVHRNCSSFGVWTSSLQRSQYVYATFIVEGLVLPTFNFFSVHSAAASPPPPPLPPPPPRNGSPSPPISSPPPPQVTYLFSPQTSF